MRTLALILLLSSTAWADAVTYQFRGEGLSGSFQLDGSTPFEVTSDFQATQGIHRSRLNRISGLWKDVAFEGTPWLTVTDVHSDFSEDAWIVRSVTTGSLGGLNLFINRNGAASLPISFDVPEHATTYFNFQFCVILPDGSFSTLPLSELNRLDGVAPLSASIAEVPEGSSAGMLMAGLLAVTLLKVRRR